MPWTYVIENLNGEGIVGTFYEKDLQKKNQTEFRIVIKKNPVNYDSIGIVMIILLIAR